MKIVAADIFCGIGGMTRGLMNAGIEVKAGVDCDDSCRYAYEENNGAEFICMDVKEVVFRDLEKYYDGADVKVLCGGPPCQKFSSFNRKYRHREEAHQDYGLAREFLRLAEEGQVDIVAMENVPGFAKSKAFGAFAGELQDMGYQVQHEVVSCLDYGVPQTRNRLILLGSRLGEISLLPPKPCSRKPTVGDFIGHLPPLRRHGKASSKDPAHTSRMLSDNHLQRIRMAKPGGTWNDWNPPRGKRLCLTTYYPAPYGRMQFDAPAPTLSTLFCYFSTGRFGHPSQDRTISIREGALLQTFPEDYKLANPGGSSIRQMAIQIGNAVPVKLAQAIGDSIVKHAQECAPQATALSAA